MGRQLQAAQGIGNLGIAGTQALGTLGLQKAGLGELSQKQSLLDIETMFNLGKQQQLQDQAVLEAQKQNQLAALYEPFNRISFLSDIYRVRCLLNKQSQRHQVRLFRPPKLSWVLV